MSTSALRRPHDEAAPRSVPDRRRVLRRLVRRPAPGSLVGVALLPAAVLLDSSARVGGAVGSSVMSLLLRRAADLAGYKRDFPTEVVYVGDGKPTLRLVTCGGEFDRKSKSYRSNVVVFAKPLGVREKAHTREGDAIAAARRRLPTQCRTVLGRPRNPSVTRSRQSWAALRHPSFHRLVSISTNGSSVLPLGGCCHDGGWPSRSHRRTVMRSVPSSAAMRVMDAPAARSRAASSC